MNQVLNFLDHLAISAASKTGTEIEMKNSNAKKCQPKKLFYQKSATQEFFLRRAFLSRVPVRRLSVHLSVLPNCLFVRLSCPDIDERWTACHSGCYRFATYKQKWEKKRDVFRSFVRFHVPSVTKTKQKQKTKQRFQRSSLFVLPCYL